ncbi:MAG TPA: hypothetical protein PL048_24285 [Leptospiraceae bacterium]|nr:hypothetical protein [Leptospiraceae bacterium]HMZ61912.1 hypothetical protein [Leptospiraceae bacterium]HNF16172.1 hypothetical protein [Leptospiraceae bacterium]HNF27450.1 hypothetical protein [Leptospiraceae bacterium]HNH08961.1 hypothetical protein [Leptospiraceae bacterium]
MSEFDEPVGIFRNVSDLEFQPYITVENSQVQCIRTDTLEKELIVFFQDFIECETRFFQNLNLRGDVLFFFFAGCDGVRE